MSQSSSFPIPDPPSARTAPFSFDRRLILLKRRLIREASFAIGMLDTALDCLWRLDREGARDVTRRDDRVDHEEVQIEEECLSILALHHAFARDLRVVTFILKVNNDIERVADHASSIAKISQRIVGSEPPAWPMSLRELGARVPLVCHELMRAVLDENVDAARALLPADRTIDALNHRLFEETVEMMARDRTTTTLTNGLHISRIGRELERVGDLMTNVAEDIVYLATGEIIRHTEKQHRRSGV